MEIDAKTCRRKLSLETICPSAVGRILRCRTLLEPSKGPTQPLLYTVSLSLQV